MTRKKQAPKKITKTALKNSVKAIKALGIFYKDSGDELLKISTQLYIDEDYQKAEQACAILFAKIDKV